MICSGLESPDSLNKTSSSKPSDFFILSNDPIFYFEMSFLSILFNYNELFCIFLAAHIVLTKCKYLYESMSNQIFNTKLNSAFVILYFCFCVSKGLLCFCDSRDLINGGVISIVSVSSIYRIMAKCQLTFWFYEFVIPSGPSWYLFKEKNCLIFNILILFPFQGSCFCGLPFRIYFRWIIWFRSIIFGNNSTWSIPSRPDSSSFGKVLHMYKSSSSCLLADMNNLKVILS